MTHISSSQFREMNLSPLHADTHNEIRAPLFIKFGCSVQVCRVIVADSAFFVCLEYLEVPEYIVRLYC